MENLLRNIGLTEGEIKVYKALIKLKKSSVGLIIKESKISASKIYVILDKLIEKGMVSFIIENNVKQFSITNPRNIYNYIEKQEKELKSVKVEAEEIISLVSKQLGTYEEESAQIYKGWAGIRVAFDNILNELDKKTEYVFFSVSSQEFEKKEHDFFYNIHKKRAEKKIGCKGIFQEGMLKKVRAFRKLLGYETKEYKLTLPSSITIGKTRILLTLFGGDPIAFEIISPRLAQRYRDYFYRIWKIAKK